MKLQQLLQAISQACTQGLRTTLAVGLIALSIGFSFPSIALASPVLIADFSDVKQEAKEAFDDVFGIGASDRVEGNVDRSIGEAKKQTGKLKGQVDDDFGAGIGDRIEGQFDKTVGETKRQVGKVKGKVEDAFERTEAQGKQQANSIQSEIERQQNRLENQNKSATEQLESVFNLDN
jgi:uncharacterized protein YjbJ (UPF0337 family)